MNTPTPRTDAATYPADCLGKTLVTNRDFPRALETELGTLTGAYTCTHHNDAERTACPICLVTTLTAERDQLRAENITLRAAQKACEACDEPAAFEVRQLRAEMERTDAIYQRACEVEQELRAELAEMHKSFAGNVHMENRVLQTALAAEREKAERYRLVTLRQDAELAAERARLDWVFRNCKVTADDFTTGNRDVYAIHDREDLGAAMKEDAT